MSNWRPDNDTQLTPGEADDLQAYLQEENDRDWTPDDEPVTIRDTKPRICIGAGLVGEVPGIFPTEHYVRRVHAINCPVCGRPMHPNQEAHPDCKRSI